MTGFLDCSFGASGFDVGDIGNSLRFRRSASAALTWTGTATPSDPTKWAYSVWCKRGLLDLSDWGTILGAAIDASNGISLLFNTANRLALYHGSLAINYFVSAPVFRDPVAPFHLYVTYNTNATDALPLADRICVYLNGQRIAGTVHANVTLGLTASINVASRRHFIGAAGTSAGPTAWYFDGYLSRIAFVDGATPNVSAFGGINSEINEWVSKTQAQVKAVVDAGGANSFMLDFDNGTSLTTLGYDKSAKGNNWTLNNVSLTPGVTYDWMLDVPGNSYATFSPLTPPNGGAATYSAGNLQVTTTASGSWGGGGIQTTLFVRNQKAYAEFVWTSGSYANVGVQSADSPLSTRWYYYDGRKFTNGVSDGAYGAAWTLNDVIGVALDTVNGTVEFYKNGVSQGVAYSNLGASSSWTFVVEDGSGGSSASFVALFGQAPLLASASYHASALGYFAYPPPAGFKALCQANMPEPAIPNPEKHFDIRTRAGNGGTQIQTGLLFQPYFKWTKNRQGAYNHVLTDGVRGANQFLYSNSTSSESSASGNFFDEGSYGLGPSGEVNANGESYVDWLWKAGGAPVTNNAGSIQSQVSANVEAGFSIVTYTGNGANATVGHGLLTAPKFVMVKRLNSSTNSNWVVQHAGLSSADNYLMLNSTAAQTAGATVWSSTFAGNSVFSIGTNPTVNVSGAPYVAYCFAEIPDFSKLGRYIGNGSADGPFVHCGFKPKYVLIKRIDTAADWVVFDAARNPFNLTNFGLIPNTAAAEFTVVGSSLDILSSGFKPRGAGAEVNISGATYIYYAVADVPAKYSLAR